MIPAFVTHFGLKALPFSKEVADGDLWIPSSKKGLVDELADALRERSSVLLTGDPGVGKTCVLRMLRHTLPNAGFRLTYCHNATLGRRDFYRQLCLALGLSPSATAAAVFWMVSTHIQDLGREQLHPVFLLDEAHLLHQDTLDHLHILLNYEWDSRALLSIVLVGLPELRERFALNCHRPLYSRLHTRLVIEPASLADSTEYLRYRLRRAGCERDLFSEEAVALLHEASGGLHRELDRLSTHALRRAATSRHHRVERDHVAALLAV